MAGGHRRATAGKNSSAKRRLGNDDSLIVSKDDGEDNEEPSLEKEIARLRGRWELASVLNFLTVFEPVIGGDLKLTVEEIETSLIKPNASLSQLHIKLLKGIPPVSNQLNDPGAWVTVLCKKLSMWWPWVAEGEIPISAANGKEISHYMEFDATTRLLILKALCEVRTQQKDMVSYINDALKNGTKISCFRKDMIGENGKGTSYWYDGSTVTGYRLYKEVRKSQSKTKMKRQASKSLPAICFQWETLATNLSEFQNSVDELSSSKVGAEFAIGKIIETDVLPVIQKFQKKKERALKQKQRQEKLLNIKSYGTQSARSCRNNRAISYTYAEYDRAIDEAIKLTMERKTTEQQTKQKKHIVQGNSASSGDSCMHTDSEGGEHKRVTSDNGNVNKGSYMDSETESDSLQKPIKDDDEFDNDYDIKQDNENGCKSGNSEEEDNLGKMNCVQKHFGSRWSSRLAGVPDDLVVRTKNLGAKHTVRQRPTRNTALESIMDGSDELDSFEHGADDVDLVVPDSNNEKSSDCTNSVASAQEDVSEVGDSIDASNL